MFRRECIVINMRSAIALIMIFVLGGIRQSQTTNLENQKNNHSTTPNNNNSNEVLPLTIKTFNETNANIFCPGDGETSCANLTFPCIRCVLNYSCYYGRDLNVSCAVLENVQCQGDRTFQRTMNCRYCYQTELWQQTCVRRGNCNSASTYRTNCTVHSDVICLGNRSFTRNLQCNWTQGYRWSTALIISITLGGFGADRFYLGHWQEGIGKLFSFGGLGVWTIIDVLLISLHYLGPADGSLYI